ncbi:MAG TPA: PKD-like domain-containing protein, partial [Bacteroidia bacterium]|nr:PKD-like domain-containing protein [Bacteroidia bacterium]
MKKINILLFFIATALFFNTVKIYAQGNTCATATPFCTAVGTPFSYPNDASGSTGQAGPSYGCLCTEPNPGWFYIKSLSAGTMSFNISQSNGDVDFVAWGPFTAANFGTACSNLNGACQGGCGTTVNPPCSGGIADCSYSINATENMTLNATAAGQYYLVMITNFQGSAGTITLTETSGPSSDCSISCPVLSAVGSKAVCSGAAVSATTFSTSLAPTTLTWTNSNTNIGLAASGSGNIAAYTAPVVATQQVGVITVTATKAGCTNSVQTFTITINPKPTVSSAPGAQTVCSGAAVSAEAFTSTPAGGTFAWTNSNTNIGIAASGSGNIAGYTAPVVATQQVGTISVTPTLNGCAGTAGTFNITINPKPTVSSAPGAQAVCSGAAVSAEAFTSTPAGGTFAWTNSNTNIGIAAAGAGNIAGYVAPVVATQQVGTISVTPTLNGCAGTAGTFNITINPKPTVSSAPGAQAVCSGAAVAAEAFTSTPAGGTFAWTNSNTNIGIAAAGAGNIAGYVAPVVATQQVGTISVTPTLNGCAGTAGTFNITINPIPTVSSAPGAQTVCSGSAVSAEAFTSTPAGGTFAWTNSNTNIGIAAAGAGNIAGYVAPVVATQQVGTISVTPTLNGCAGTPGSFNITINPQPTFSLTGNAYTICNGGSQTFTVSGASTYTWTPVATLTGANTANPTASPTTTTVYSVTGTSALGCGNLTPATVTVNITAVPSMVLKANSYTICNGGSQTFTVSGVSTYTWSPAATLNNANIANPTANPTTTTVYTVNGTASGCAQSAPLTLTLTVNPLPTYTLASNSYTICSGSSQTFTVSGASTYTWTPAATLTGANTANPTASPTTTTVYSVTGTSASNCSNLTPATVTVNVNPMPTYSLTSNVYTICNGGSQTFSVSGASTYTWTPAATLTGANTATPTASPTTTTVYSVTGTSVLGCGNLTPATVTVNVTAVPSMSLAASSYTICNGASQTFTVSGASTYTWTPAATLTGASTANPTATPTTTTIYTVNGTASGCASSPPLTVKLTVNPLPTYSLTANSYTICNGASQTFTVSGASTYTWTPAATLTGANTATPTASPTTTTVYSVTGTSASACSNLIPATVTVTVNPLPTYSLSGNVYTICNGGSQTFSVSGAST